MAKRQVDFEDEARGIRYTLIDHLAVRREVRGEVWQVCKKTPDGEYVPLGEIFTKRLVSSFVLADLVDQMLTGYMPGFPAGSD